MAAAAAKRVPVPTPISVTDVVATDVFEAGYEMIEYRLACAGRVARLERVGVTAHVCEAHARVDIEQQWTIPDGGREWVYRFPLDPKACLCSLVVRVGQRVLEATVVESAEAKLIYDTAVASGVTSVLLKRDARDIVSLSIGAAAAGERVVTAISYAAELTPTSHTERGTGVEHQSARKFVFPSFIPPRYPGAAGQTYDIMARRLGHGHGPIQGRVSSAQTTMSFSADVTMRHPFSITLPDADERNPASSASTKLRVGEMRNDEGYGMACRIEGTAIPMTQDVVFTVAPGVGYDHGSSARAQTGSAVATWDPVRRVASVALTLNVTALAEPPVWASRTFGLLIDTSGSMSDDNKMVATRGAAINFLLGLPADAAFFVASFNYRAEVLVCDNEGRTTADRLPSPVLHRGNTRDVQDAINFVQKLQAGGGTEMLGAFTEVFEKLRDSRRRTRDCSLLVITDGLIDNVDSVSRLVGNAATASSGDEFRCTTFVLGVGKDVSHGMITAVAAAGHGCSDIAFPGDRDIPAKVLAQMQRMARAPGLLVAPMRAIDVSSGAEIATLFSPKELRVYSGLSSTLYYIIGPFGASKRPEIIDVQCRIGQQALSSKINLLATASNSGTSQELNWLMKLAAHTLLSELETSVVTGNPDARRHAEKLAANIAVEYQVMSRFTSMVAVDRSARQICIPIAVTPFSDAESSVRHFSSRSGSSQYLNAAPASASGSVLSSAKSKTMASRSAVEHASESAAATTAQIDETHVALASAQRQDDLWSAESVRKIFPDNKIDEIAAKLAALKVIDADDAQLLENIAATLFVIAALNVSVDDASFLRHNINRAIARVRAIIGPSSAAKFF